MLSKALERSNITKAVTSLLSIALSTVQRFCGMQSLVATLMSRLAFLLYHIFRQLIVLKQHVHISWKELAAMIWDDYCLPPHDPHPLTVG